MKVLFTFAGLPHYFNYVLNRLNRINHLHVTVVIPQGKSVNIGKGVFHSSKEVEFKVVNAEETHAYYKKPFIKDFIRILQQEKPDIIVTIWPYILGFVFYPQLLRFIRKNNIKLIFKDIPFQVPKFSEGITFKYNLEFTEDLNERNLLKNKINLFFLTALRKIYYKIPDAHVNYTKDAYEILESYGVTEEKIFVTYNSPDTDRLFAASEEAKKQAPLLPENKYRIAHIGRLVKWKRVDLLIEAVAKLKEKFPLIELIVIGNGPEEEPLKTLAKNLNITKNIRFLGAVYNPVTLGRYLHDSSIYALAGMGGLSINEAMAFGKPVICSICDGTEKELVREGVSGFYFNNGCSKDLADKIDVLLSDPQKITTMGSNAYKIIRDEININKVVSGYLDSFNYVTNNNLRNS